MTTKPNLPELRIKNAWLLRENASVHIHKLFAKEGVEMCDHKSINKTVVRYSKAWVPQQKQILTAMCDIMGLEFRQNIIDVYIAPWFYAFSDPMVIGIKMTQKEFVSNLTHELIHRLLTDNTSLPYDYDLISIWGELFGKNHAITTLVHIPVHAIHKAIIVDVLNDPSIKDDDLERCLGFEGKDGDYVKSWEYVDKHDYKKIIEKLKGSYKS